MTKKERSAVRKESPVGKQYDQDIDRESAAEILKERAANAAEEAAAKRKAEKEKASKTRQSRSRSSRSGSGSRRRSTRMSKTEKMVNSAIRTIGMAIGTSLMRGIMGVLTKGR